MRSFRYLGYKGQQQQQQSQTHEVEAEGVGDAENDD